LATFHEIIKVDFLLSAFPGKSLAFNYVFIYSKLSTPIALSRQGFLSPGKAKFLSFGGRFPGMKESGFGIGNPLSPIFDRRKGRLSQ
jgi:hypothetical protein